LNLLALLLLQFQNPLVPPLERMLQWLNETIAPINPIPEVIGSFAIALIVVAVLVKIVTYPLSLAQMRSMRNMQALQPKMAELQEKHKGDKAQLSQAQMELYKEQGVNPFGGCLPLIITMVVLFSMIGAVRALKPEMEGQPFFWIPNIADCEANPGCHGFIPHGLPILVLVMVLSQFLYQKYMTPPTADPSAQTLNASMKFMPIIFGFFFITLPAGMVLYYLVFNVVSLGQQLIINRQLSPAAAELPVPVVGEKSAKSAAPEGTASPEEQAENGRGDNRRRRRKKSP
jgi:YidC/Oxa1 family membrane protein insertase